MVVQKPSKVGHELQIFRESPANEHKKCPTRLTDCKWFTSPADAWEAARGKSIGNEQTKPNKLKKNARSNTVRKRKDKENCAKRLLAHLGGHTSCCKMLKQKRCYSANDGSDKTAHDPHGCGRDRVDGA